MLNDDASVFAFQSPLPSATLPTARVAPPLADVFAVHAGYVLGLLRRLGVADADLEDVAQEVFWTVHVQLAGFEGRSKLKTWICGIALRKASDYRRKAHRRREQLWAEPPESVTDGGPEDFAARNQEVEFLRRVLEQLPPKQRDVFVLYEVEGLPMADVVKIVGCPLFTGHSRLNSARRAVREAFGGAARTRSGA